MKSFVDRIDMQLLSPINAQPPSFEFTQENFTFDESFFEPENLIFWIKFFCNLWNK